MSDYEDDVHMDTNYVEMDTENENVISHLIINLKKTNEVKSVHLYIKYYDERDASDADSDEYYNDMHIIEPFLSLRYPGWNIDSIRTEELNANNTSYFDLDLTILD